MNNDIEEKSSTSSFSRIKFYFEKSRLIGNICTVCLLLDNDKKVLARGVAICSLKDAHKKSEGRDKSFGRAFKALVNVETSDPVNSDRKNLNKTFIKKINSKETYYEEIVDEAAKKHFETYKKGDNLIVKIPFNFPLTEVSDSIGFKFKSEYNPYITNKEKLILGV